MNSAEIKKAETDFEEVVVEDEIEGRVRVALEYIGEGYSGDFDDEDEEDMPLIRFTVYEREFGIEIWEQVDDSSYCTQIPITTPREQLEGIARSILAEVEDPILRGYSIKKLCERLSWIEVNKGEVK